MVPCLRLGNVLYRIESESDRTIVNTDRNTIKLEDYDPDAAQHRPCGARDALFPRRLSGSPLTDSRQPRA